jgi:hypothetical protein
VVLIDGAEFLLKVIEPKTFRRLSARLSRSRMFLNGGKPGLSVGDVEKVKLDDEGKYLEAEEMLQDAFREFVRHGVSGHSGIKKKTGEEVLFKADDGGLVSDETLELYDLQRWILRLGNEVISFNALSEDDRKN